MKEIEKTPKLLDREFFLRVISALVLAAFCLIVTWRGGVTFTLFCVALAFLVLFEFNKITASAAPFICRLFSYFGFLIIAYAWVTDQMQMSVSITLLAASLIGVFEFTLRRTIWSGVGILYSLLPMIAMSELREESLSGLIAIMILFACVWGSDIFAYFAGRLIGGPKLAPQISPKKTWAGFIGGLGGALLLTSLFVYFAGYSVSSLLILAVCLLAIVSQLGDLAESMLKRRFDVKDSGNLIPGHGGVLDRIDGLIFAAPMLWLIGWIVVRNDSLTTSHAESLFNALMVP